MPDLATLAQISVSGLYVRRQQILSQGGVNSVVVDTVRLDVDGYYPLLRASGLFYPAGLYSLGGPVYWISDELAYLGGGVWQATIRRRFPDPTFGEQSVLPHTNVSIHVLGGGLLAATRKLTLTFSGGAPEISKTLEFESPYFRTAEFEFDAVETAPRVTRIDTRAHPEHANVEPRTLSIAEVYSQAGVDLQQSPNTSVVGLEAGGTGAEIWDDQQLHDAMRAFWSRYKPRAQWAGWLLFAHRHRDPALNGIMFDYGGNKFGGGSLSVVNPNDGIERQGAAVFGEAIANHVPADERFPELWLPRRRFFTALHELGHCFNLGHSWEKQGANPWITLFPDDQALSIMNYPERVANFWQNFKYRFTDQELYFIRHAPEEFVEMGDAGWGENHGDRVPLQRGRVAANHPLTLEIAASRPRRLFEFLEPVTLELKLTNRSSHPQFVDPATLNEAHALTLVIAPHGGLAKEWLPYARRCYFADLRILQPGESLRTSIFASAGVGGWYLAEPGAYTVHARLETPGGGIFAEPLTLRVAAPRSWDEEYLAQDFFTDDVGRTLAFGGTHVMNDALETLRESTDRCKDRAVARHATLALGLPLMRDTRVLRLPQGQAPMSSVAADGGKFEVINAKPDEARGMLQQALLHDSAGAVETFGQLAYERHIEMYAEWLHQSGDAAAAAEACAGLLKVTYGRAGKLAPEKTN